MRPKRPAPDNSLMEQLDSLKKDTTDQTAKMNKAMKKMADAISVIATDEEKKSFSFKQGGPMTQISTLAEAFEIIAKRIQDIDKTIVRENGPAARSLPKPKQ